MQLSGNPRVQESSGDLNAASIELMRTTGNADATGGVKATYRQANGQPGMALGGNGPVHVISDQAHLDHATDLTTFYGKAAEPARLWQGSDSIAAPVLELSRSRGTLAAHGPAGDAAAVNAVFTGSPSNAATPAKPPAQVPQSSVVRVQSRTLFYAENDHKAVFSGAAVAADVDRGSAFELYRCLFHPAAGRPTAAQDCPGQPGFPGGSAFPKRSGHPEQSGVKDRRPRCGGISAARTQRDRRGAHLHHGGWQVLAYREQRRASAVE